MHCKYIRLKCFSPFFIPFVICFLFPKCLCLCLCLDVDVDGDGDGGCVIKHSTQLQPYFAPCTQIWKYLTIYKLWDCKNQKAACISSEIENPPCSEQ